jgi:pimeloyl-ACP methyl ester carboxylesterase
MFGDNYYVVHFQQPGVADAGLARNVRRVFTQLMRSGVPLEGLAELALRGDGQMRNMVELVESDVVAGEPVLSGDELQVYVDAFSRTGFTGGINWYRNMERNWERSAHLEGKRIEVPSLMVTAEWDPVLRPEMAAGMPSFVPDLEIHMIEKCGHWTQQEKPRELNRIMVDWLTRRFGAR